MQQIVAHFAAWNALPGKKIFGHVSHFYFTEKPRSSYKSPYQRKQEKEVDRLKQKVNDTDMSQQEQRKHLEDTKKNLQYKKLQHVKTELV